MKQSKLVDFNNCWSVWCSARGGDSGSADPTTRVSQEMDLLMAQLQEKRRQNSQQASKLELNLSGSFAGLTVFVLPDRQVFLHCLAPGPSQSSAGLRLQSMVLLDFSDSSFVCGRRIEHCIWITPIAIAWRIGYETKFERARELCYHPC